MGQLNDRLKAKTPLWFKRIRKAGYIMFSVAGALIAATVATPGFELPTIVNTICQWTMVAGITASTVATTAKEDHA